MCNICRKRAILHFRSKSYANFVSRGVQCRMESKLRSRGRHNPCLPVPSIRCFSSKYNLQMKYNCYLLMIFANLSHERDEMGRQRPSKLFLRSAALGLPSQVIKTRFRRTPSSTCTADPMATSFRSWISFLLLELVLWLYLAQLIVQGIQLLAKYLTAQPAHPIVVLGHKLLGVTGAYHAMMLLLL